MSQQSSERDSKDSTSHLLTTPSRSSSERTSLTSPYTPFSVYSLTSASGLQTSPIDRISPPAPPRQIHRLSDIIDPLDILPNAYPPFDILLKSGERQVSGKGIVHSPSGNALAPDVFIAHPDRPLAVWERQQRIITNTKELIERYKMESRAATIREVCKEDEGKDGHEKANRAKRRCCRLWW